LSKCFQCLSLQSHLCHNHRNLRALPNFSKSLNPSTPPLIFWPQTSLPIDQVVPSLYTLWVLSPPEEASSESIHYSYGPFRQFEDCEEVDWHCSEDSFYQQLSSRICQEFSFPTRQSVANFLHQRMEDCPRWFSNA
jgi:hypothetical protein